MGQTFNVQVPASGNGSVPFNLKGQTLISCSSADVQIAYDENGFNTNQWMTLSGANSPQVFFLPETGKTVLWVRVDPDIGIPTTTRLDVWTDIGGGAY